MILQAAPGRVVLLFAAVCLLVPAGARAQVTHPPPPEAEGQGILPEASFETTFRKYGLSENRFSPYYSWDATMTLDLTILRRGPSEFEFGGLFETVGTENLGTKVSVGGTGYLLRLAYVRSCSRSARVSAGIAHLSSHLTRDLDDKTEEQRAKGAAIPVVDDPSEYNVPFVKGQLTLSRWRFTPQLEASFHPINIRFDGGPRRGVRPLHLGSRWTIWRSRGKSVAVETQHEIGKHSFSAFAASLELLARDGQDARFALVVSGSPGHQLHVSPDVGGLRDGIAFGIRMRFRS